MQQENIQLVNQLTGVPHEFSYEHAVRLLTQEKKRGFTSWNLPPDSKYLFKDGNIIIKPGRRGTDRAKTAETDREGEETRTSNPDAHGSDTIQ